MKYLGDNKIIHRDLGLRNILVSGTVSSATIVAKVADFGLSRLTQEGIYQSSQSKEIPVKWSPLEVIDVGKYSSASDVWSFGVTLWELFSRGILPYGGLSNFEAVTKIREGYRMPKPKLCSDEVFALIQRCWAEKPEERITFATLVQEFSAYDHYQISPSLNGNSSVKEILYVN